MESHSKHGDSIYWHDASTLYVNLFIASTLDWDGWKLDLATRFPFEDKVTLTVTKPGKTRDLALRLPGWANDPTIAINDTATPIERRDGYALLRRRWRPGDRVTLTLPMTPAVEPTPDRTATRRGGTEGVSP